LRSFVEAEYKGSDWKIALSKKFDDTSSYGTNISRDSSNKDGCVILHGYPFRSLNRLRIMLLYVVLQLYNYVTYMSLCNLKMNEELEAFEPTLKYEPGTIVADGDFVMVHERYSDRGQRVNWTSFALEHWDVIQDEVTQVQSKSGLPMAAL